MSYKGRKRISVTNVKNTMTLEEGKERFLKVKKAMGLSSKSLMFYSNCFRYFTEFFGSYKSWGDITNATMLEYTMYLQNKNIAPATVNSYLIGMRTILNYFVEMGYIEKIEVKKIKAGKKLTDIYTEEEIEKLLMKPDINERGFGEYRDWVIICYILGTGNRLGTIVNIKIEDVDLKRGQVNLHHTKNGKAYRIPIPNSLINTLTEYLQYRNGNSTDYLFCSVYGSQITSSALQSAIQRYNTRRGVSKTSIHLFRHTFATHFIWNGGSIYALKELLEHSSIKVTEDYISLLPIDMEIEIEEFNPLEKLMKNTRPKHQIYTRKK